MRAFRRVHGRGVEFEEQVAEGVVGGSGFEQADDFQDEGQDAAFGAEGGEFGFFGVAEGFVEAGAGFGRTGAGEQEEAARFHEGGAAFAGQLVGQGQQSLGFGKEAFALPGGFRSSRLPLEQRGEAA